MDGIKTVGVIAVIDVLCTASAPLNSHHLSTLCSAPQVHQSGTHVQSESLRLAPPQLCPTSSPCRATTLHGEPLHLPPTLAPTAHAYHPRLHPHLPPTPTPTPTTHAYTHTYHPHLHPHLPPTTTPTPTTYTYTYTFLPWPLKRPRSAPHAPSGA
jgi:hypothetical protein